MTPEEFLDMPEPPVVIETLINELEKQDELIQYLNIKVRQLEEFVNELMRRVNKIDPYENTQYDIYKKPGPSGPYWTTGQSQTPTSAVDISDYINRLKAKAYKFDQQVPKNPA